MAKDSDELDSHMLMLNNSWIHNDGWLLLSLTRQRQTVETGSPPSKLMSSDQHYQWGDNSADSTNSEFLSKFCETYMVTLSTILHYPHSAGDYCLFQVIISKSNLIKKRTFDVMSCIVSASCHAVHIV